MWPSEGEEGVEEGLYGDGLKTQTEGDAPSVMRKNVVDLQWLLVVTGNELWKLVSTNS